MCLSVMRKREEWEIMLFVDAPLRKLLGSKWGVHSQTIATTALSLYYSTTEYDSALWYKSAHAKQVGGAFNESCRIIAVCLKPTST